MEKRKTFGEAFCALCKRYEKASVTIVIDHAKEELSVHSYDISDVDTVFKILQNILDQKRSRKAEALNVEGKA